MTNYRSDRRLLFQRLNTEAPHWPPFVVSTWCPRLDPMVFHQALPDFQPPLPLQKSRQKECPFTDSEPLRRKEPSQWSHVPRGPVKGAAHSEEPEVCGKSLWRDRFNVSKQSSDSSQYDQRVVDAMGNNSIAYERDHPVT